MKPLARTPLLAFLLLIACESEPLSGPDAPHLPFGAADAAPAQAGAAQAVEFRSFIAEGEAFACFVGPDPEDLRMQGYASLVFGDDEHVLLSTTTIVEPPSPEGSGDPTAPGSTPTEGAWPRTPS